MTFIGIELNIASTLTAILSAVRYSWRCIYTDTLRNTPVILDVGMFSFLLDLTTRCGVSVKDNCISFVITYVRDISHKVEIRTRCTPARAI